MAGFASIFGFGMVSLVFPAIGIVGMMIVILALFLERK